jgi:hypothetical protein
MPVTGVVTPPARLVRSYGGLEGRRQAEGRRGPLSPPVARLGAAEDPLRAPLRHAAIGPAAWSGRYMAESRSTGLKRHA